MKISALKKLNDWIGNRKWRFLKWYLNSLSFVSDGVYRISIIRKISGRILYEHAITLQVNELWSRSLNAYDRYLSVKPESANGRFRKGYCEERLSRFELAIKDYKTAIDLSSAKAPWNWRYRLMLAYELSADFENAIAQAMSIKNYDECNLKQLRDIFRVIERSVENGECEKEIKAKILEKLHRIDPSNPYWIERMIVYHSIARNHNKLKRLFFSDYGAFTVGVMMSQLRRNDKILIESLHKEVNNRSNRPGGENVELRRLMYNFAYGIHNGDLVSAYRIRDQELLIIRPKLKAASKIEDYIQASSCLCISLVNEYEYLCNVINKTMESSRKVTIFNLLMENLVINHCFYEARNLREKFQKLIEDKKEMDSYFEFLKGKSVAVVGPAQNGFNGNEIDTFDVVIRTNFKGVESINDKRNVTGSKTDVTYQNIENYRMGMRDTLIKLKKEEELKYIMVRSGVDREITKRWVSKLTRVRVATLINSRSGSGKRFASSHILHELMIADPKRIKVFNMDFFLSKEYHISGYYNNKLDIASSFIEHDVKESFVRMKTLYEMSLIEADCKLSAILSRRTECFLNELEHRLQNPIQ